MYLEGSSPGGTGCSELSWRFLLSVVFHITYVGVAILLGGGFVELEDRKISIEDMYCNIEEQARRVI